MADVAIEHDRLRACHGRAKGVGITWTLDVSAVVPGSSATPDLCWRESLRKEEKKNINELVRVREQMQNAGDYLNHEILSEIIG